MKRTVKILQLVNERNSSKKVKDFLLLGGGGGVFHFLLLEIKIFVCTFSWIGGS